MIHLFGEPPLFWKKNRVRPSLAGSGSGCDPNPPRASEAAGPPAKSFRSLKMFKVDGSLTHSVPFFPPHCDTVSHGVFPSTC